MKSSLTLSILTLLVSTVPLFAATDGILANTPTFKPRVTVSDIYSERVVAEVDGGDVYRSLELNPQRISLSLTANLDGAVTGVIDGNTAVALNAENFSHSDTLGNAIDYTPGAKKATFLYTADVDLPNGDTKEVRVGTITYAWTAKRLTVTLAISDVEAGGSTDIAATNYTDAPESGERIAILDDPIDVEVDFGEASGSRRVFLRGFVRKVTKGFGAPTSDNYEEFDITDANVQGAADTAGPVIRPIFQPRPDLQNKVAVSGTVADQQEVTLNAVTVNNVAVTGATVTLSEADAAGLSTWSVSGIGLRKGPNAVALIFSDEDGNLTRVARNYTLR